MELHTYQEDKDWHKRHVIDAIHQAGREVLAELGRRFRTEVEKEAAESRKIRAQKAAEQEHNAKKQREQEMKRKMPFVPK